jgi:SLT domain-containing protein
MAYKKFDTFRTVVNAVVNQVASNFEFMANAFIAMVNVVIKGINLIKPGKDIGTLGQISIGRLGGDSGGAGGANPAGLDYKAFANGGIISRPTLALMGERGPEMVVPLTGPNAGAGMGGGVTINVNGGDPNAVVDALRKYMRQNGSVPMRTANIY